MGNDKDFLTGAVLQCLPYIGYPRSLNAIACVKKGGGGMKPKTIAKLAVDILMTVLLLLLMGYHFWGKAAHEWIGAGILLLFVAHHLLNFELA